MRYKDFWIALGFGALAGGLAALLFAPQSGRKTRKQLKRNLTDASEALDKAGDYLKTHAEYLSQEAQKLIDQGKGQIDSVVESAGGYAQTAGKLASDYVDTAAAAVKKLA